MRGPDGEARIGEEEIQSSATPSKTTSSLRYPHVASRR